MVSKFNYNSCYHIVSLAAVFSIVTQRRDDTKNGCEGD